MLNAKTLRQIHCEIEGVEGFVPSDFIITSSTDEKKNGTTNVVITYALDERFKLYVNSPPHGPEGRV